MAFQYPQEFVNQLHKAIADHVVSIAADGLKAVPNPASNTPVPNGRGSEIRPGRNGAHFTTTATNLPGFECEFEGKKYRVQPQCSVNVFYASDSEFETLTATEQRQLNTGNASDELKAKAKRIGERLAAL